MGNKSDDELEASPSNTLDPSEQIHKAIAALENDMKAALSGKTTPSSTFKDQFDQIQAKIDQLKAKGVSPSDILDLESHLANLNRFLTANLSKNMAPTASVDKYQIHKSIVDLLKKQGVKKEEISRSIELIDDYIESGKPLKDLLQISDNTIEIIYTSAYTLYQNARYDEAIRQFYFLTLLTPWAAKFHMGVAACLHHQKNYPDAIRIYILVIALDPTNPFPHFYLHDCQLELGFIPAAKASLRQVISLGIEKPQYAVLVHRAGIILAKLTKEYPELT